jgi:hypothetical protein
VKVSVVLWEAACGRKGVVVLNGLIACKQARTVSVLFPGYRFTLPRLRLEVTSGYTFHRESGNEDYNGGNWRYFFVFELL